MAFSLRFEHRLIFYENIGPVFGRLPSMSCPPREDPRLCKGVAFSSIASPGPIFIQIQSIYAENHKKKEGSPRRGPLPIAIGETERSDDEPTECPMPKGTPPTGMPIEKPADTSRHTPSARPRKKHLPLHRGKVEGLAWDESDRGREGDCRWK